MTTTQAADSGIAVDPKAPYGFTRPAALQAQFEQAAGQLRTSDSWNGPGPTGLNADLALEGGGVKGIGIVGAVAVLAEAGYRFQRIAGTSAGGIAAALIASISKEGGPMTGLKGYLDTLEFAKFMPDGPIHRIFDHLGKPGQAVADAGVLTHKMGIYSGDYLAEWLGPILNKDLGVTTFSDLKITQDEDPGMSLPENKRYRLVVHTSDITRGQLVHLPWDYAFYGQPADEQEVTAAVRATMSIPFFFEPVTFTAAEAHVDVPGPDGRPIRTHYEGGTVNWVDGGMLRNFPINAFDREDGGPPRWPTIGIKLSSLQTEFPATEAAKTSLNEAVHCLKTMMNEWDAYSVDAATAGRTIFVDHGGFSATDFHLTADQQNQLFLNGVTAATAFIIEMGARGRVPRSAQEAVAVQRARRAEARPG
jgi:NTE family protein